jgi:hypothetical protein
MQTKFKDRVFVDNIDMGTGEDRTVITYLDGDGKPTCTVFEGVVEPSPAWPLAMQVLANDLQLAIECMSIFGGVPIPVAEAIIRGAKEVCEGLDSLVRAKEAR